MICLALAWYFRSLVEVPSSQHCPQMSSAVLVLSPGLHAHPFPYMTVTATSLLLVLLR